MGTRLSMGSGRHWATMCLGLALSLASAQAQKLADREKPRNHPINCPYTGGDPAILEAAGIVSLGGFSFGTEDSTEAMDSYMGSSDVRWIETAHFKIGMGLGPYKIDIKEKKKILAELQRLAVNIPTIEPEKVRVLDPWLRAFLYAQRAEDLWVEMLTLLGVEEADFPDGTTPWDTTGKYMGIGPYLGEKGKLEILILPSQGASSAYLRQYFGLVTKMTQRWNIIEKDILHLVIHTQQGGLKTDGALHGHFAFNLSQQLLNAYKHYSYEIPVWLKEGIAHWMERRIDPRFNTFDGSEGASAVKTKKADWNVPTRTMILKGESVPMARLIRMQGFGEFELEHHYTTWSMVDFLMSQHPEFLGQLLDRIKGMVNERFYDDGSGLEDVHRDTFKELLGVTYSQFDRLWIEWVKANY